MAQQLKIETLNSVRMQITLTDAIKRVFEDGTKKSLEMITAEVSAFCGKKINETRVESELYLLCDSGTIEKDGDKYSRSPSVGIPNHGPNHVAAKTTKPPPNPPQVPVPSDSSVAAKVHRQHPMELLADNIGQALRKFEQEILPKTKHPSFEPKDGEYLQLRLAELNRIHEQASVPPVFSIRFLGDTANGKSTLINALLGRKILPEGHVGACSATIVRCRYSEQPKITVHLRYSSEAQFLADLKTATRDAELALIEEDSPATQREIVCNRLGRFLRLMDIDRDKIADPADLIAICRTRSLDFPERKLLGSEEMLEVTPENEQRISGNLSAKGRVAFIVDECLIQGDFQGWHPSMELVDMPGTNAFNPWDDQVNARLKQSVGGLAIVTSGTQLNDSVMEWFKESSILPEIVGASYRNQVRVFVLKTFVDQLNLPEDEDEESQWSLTRRYCAEIDKHLRSQVMELVYQRFSAPNEIEVLADFVNHLPTHFLSAKIYRNLVDEGLKKRVLSNPNAPQNLQLFAGFQRFDRNPDNTGIPELRRALHDHTEEFINTHYRRKLELDFAKEVGIVTHIFRVKRVVAEHGLAKKGEFVLEVDREITTNLARAATAYRESSDKKVVDIKNRFNEEVGQLLHNVSTDYGRKTRQKLDDWMQLHWASLRCAGHKKGQHVTNRGYEINFNGTLADFCVEALNSSWIAYRANLRKLLYDDLLLHFLPEIEIIIAQAKGQNTARIELIGATYEQLGRSIRHELEFQVEKYDSKAEAFDALRPKLALSIRGFLGPAYEGISSEIGHGSAIRMRNHLQNGVLASIQEIDTMVKQVVKESWQGLTTSVEERINDFFHNLDTGFRQQGDHLKELGQHPSGDDEHRLDYLKALEKDSEALIGISTTLEE